MVHNLRILTCLAAVAIPLLCYGTFLKWREALLPSAGSLAAGGLLDSEPTMIVERTAHDFGRVPSGALLMAGFPVRNAGRRRLVLRQQARSCECIATPQPEIIIPPGGRRNLAPTLHTENFSGLLRAELVYRTNDPHHPAVTFVLSAAVTPPAAEPETQPPLEPIPLDENR